MPSKILVAFPGPLIRELLWNERHVVMFDDGGWWIIDGSSNSRRCVDTFSFPIHWHPRCDAAKLIRVLKSWSPIWFRWIAHADQYELLYREAVMYILHVQAALSALEITSVIFHTSVSHHVDSSLLEIAAAELRIPQVFLYYNVITRRLQPLMQATSVEDRRASTLVVSDHQAADDIRAFHSRRLAGLVPKSAHAMRPWSTLFAFGVLNAYYVGARQALSRAKRRMSGRTSSGSSFFDQFEPLGTAEFVRMAATQRRALAYLRQRATHRLETLIEQSSGPVLLLVAQYQPEATSFPEGAELNNHLDIVIRLRSIGYRGVIAYREHFATAYYQAPFIHQTRVGMARSVAYFQRLEQLGCAFVDHRAPLPLDRATNDRLIPVTISGTIGVERSLAGLRTVVVGFPWYNGLPGIMSLPAVTSWMDQDVTSACPDTLAAKAFDHLDRTLSRTTIVNAPGIGSGTPMRARDTIATFRREFGCLLEQLQEAPCVRS